jgi:hypothetical protein
MKIYLRVLAIIMLVIIPSLFMLNMCSDTAQTVQKEYAPSAMLKKYEYFKDLSAAIDEKRATIETYKSVLVTIEDKSSFDYQQSRNEMLGLISMHNSLCKEYNAAMSKFNYAFCNKGTLPATNLVPLPREIKPYILSI